MLPFFTFAQELGKTKTLFGSVKTLITGTLIPLVFSLALLMFFWGVVKYIKSEGSAKEDGRKIMIWGVVAMFVMASIWGIVYLIRSELGIGSQTNMPLPTIGGSGDGAEEENGGCYPEGGDLTGC